MSKALEEYLILWNKLVELDDAGKGETEEADELRDSMDKPWYNLTAAERDKFKEDLKAGKIKG